MKRFIWVFSILLLILAVSLAVSYTKKNSQGTSPYRTAKVERGDIASLVTATGTVNALNTVEVGSQVSGTIAKLYADFNSVVREGDIIAQIDPTFLQAQVDEAEANLQKAVAAVHEAERNYNRLSRLLDQHLASQANVDEVQTALETARAQEKQATAAVNRARINLRYATIKSPINGVVISRNIERGQTVAASLQAPTLFTIAEDLTKMKLELSIDEADVGRIAEGQKVTFTVEAYPEERFEGSVSQIRLAPVSVQNVVTYSVIVNVANPELKLRPGMTASASILIDERRNVLKVPTIALNYQPSPDLLSDQGSPPSGGGERFRARADSMTMGSSFRPSGGGERFRARADSMTMGSSMASSAEASPPPYRRRRGDRGPRIWIPGPDGKVLPVLVRTGIADRSFTEIVEGDLQEGQEIIIGAALPTPVPVATGTPFGPGQPPGGLPPGVFGRRR
jgi:HlyD family secretion protein